MQDDQENPPNYQKLQLHYLLPSKIYAMTYDVEREWKAADKHGTLEKIVEKAPTWVKDNIDAEDLNQSTADMVQLGCSLYCRCHAIASQSFGAVIIKTALAEWIKHHGNTPEAREQAMVFYTIILENHLARCKTRASHIPEAYQQREKELRAIPLLIFVDKEERESQNPVSGVKHMDDFVTICTIEPAEQEK